MITIAICDDNYNDISILSKNLYRFQIENNIDFIVKQFNSGNDLVNENKNSPFQVVFIDIEMPNENGIQIASILSKQAKSTNQFIVFASSYPEYMQESFDVHPFHFITKPVTYSVIEKVMNHILEKMNNTYATKLIIDSYGETHFLSLKDIQFICSVKGDKQTLRIKLLNDQFTVKSTLVEYEKMLSDYGFISPSRGFLINVSNICSFKDKTAILEDSKE